MSLEIEDYIDGMSASRQHFIAEANRCLLNAAGIGHLLLAKHGLSLEVVAGGFATTKYAFEGVRAAVFAVHKSAELRDALREYVVESAQANWPSGPELAAPVRLYDQDAEQPD